MTLDGSLDYIRVVSRSIGPVSPYPRWDTRDVPLDCPVAIARRT